MATLLLFTSLQAEYVADHGFNHISFDRQDEENGEMGRCQAEDTWL